MIKKIIFTILVIIVILQADFGQGKTDSLKRLVLLTKTIDTNYINNCLDLAWELMYTQTDSAGFFAGKACDASQKINEPLFEANSYNTLGVSFIVRGNYEKALEALNKALSINKKLMEQKPDNRAYKRRILAIYNNIGNVNYYRGNYSVAIENYLKALHFSEDIGFISGKANCLSNIGASYKDLLDYDKALEYNYKSLKLAEKTGNNYWLSQSLNNLGTVYFSIPDYDSAKYYFSKSTKIFEQDSNEFELINCYVNIGNVYQKLKVYDSAFIFLNKALALSTKLSSPDGLINVHYILGQLYEITGQVTKSIKHFNKSIELARQTGTSRFVMLGNEELSGIYSKKGEFEKAFKLFKLSSSIRDSIFSTEHDERIAQLETKYRTREKEERIKLLTQQNALEKAQSRNRQIVFISIIVILILLLIVLALAYRSYQNRQKAIKSMMKQKAEKKVLNAVISTEYEERKRFAEELHDSMGVLLSTLKLYVNELGDCNNADNIRVDMLNRSNSLLDEVINNARTLSHNIMPASIKDNGLVFSLNSFIDKINATGKIAIHLTTSGLRKRYSAVIELSVYRMLTEMINNTLKHAGATSVDIMLAEKNNRLLITYKDNGRGFDMEALNGLNKGGLGLKNILNRIEMMGGKQTITSKKGEGFQAFVEVKTDKNE